ncbi:BTAD domain-containing putative transcriptional regulator [Kitasatospora sp. YST-16]|uniref:AfsR/SARP family transcriptional regulator n=1 Tax=Kitasatospora sp. YST-16 TaxID=2998080 RepID=UPI002284ADEC|nr:AfsR/SARP family transcriptional regulator [Kitasatospora sp. YST-16]WAL74913.1 BTAD domain-containing putative transcriptional regulator [Kitasatospora sp. YST-16]WNW40970.1 BTAD domain-containing putative transcriptional regulator [Streptomyces sp. Li-HN-5-13]
MKFRLLGAVAADGADGELRLGPEKRRSLLALLLLRRNRAVSVAQLTEALWVDEPPANARTVVQSHISRLRALLAEAGADRHGVGLTTAGDAYTLCLPEGLLDVEQFDALVAAARTEQRSTEVVGALEHALGLWRGPALTGTVPSAPLEAWRQTLEENRLAAVETLADHLQRLGEPARAAELLRAETVAHPLRESLVSALMLALFRAGRQSDAITWYHRTRESLADRLGVDPGRALNAAYERILRGEGAAAAAAGADHGGGADHAAGPADTAGPAAVPVGVPGIPVQRGRLRPTAPGPVAPAPTPVLSSAKAPERAAAELPAVDLLPRPPRGFYGRGAELAALGDALSTGPDGAIALVTGPAGVGKTALALDWAHRHGHRFPDGVLFADLGGFSDRPDRELGDVLAEFLAALGTAHEDLPPTLAGRAALYRRATTGRRLLVLVDNARESEQVRPLLPAGADSAALVTSRHRMLGLVASELARPVPLSVLGPEESSALLARVLGPARIAAEPEAARELADLCDGLPLALRIAAAKAAADPRRGLAAVTEQLRHEQRRLNHLAAEEISVTSALRISCEQLPPTAARLFRALGLHPGPMVDAYTAAALADLEHPDAAQALEQLAATHLVTETDAEQYTLHDLVWLYARQLAAETSRAEQRTARARLADQYLYAGLAAAQCAEPGSKPCCEPPAGSHRPRAVPEFTTIGDALHWIGAHRETLAEVIATATPERTWRLVLTQWPLILRRVRDGWVPQLQLALEAAVEAGDLDGESQVRALLGWVLVSNRRLHEAAACLAPAAELAARADNQVGRAIALINLAAVHSELADHAAAGAGLAQALEIALAADHPHTTALALLNLARHHLGTGRPRPALDHALHGLALSTGTHSDPRRVLLHTTAGEALSALGRHPEARARLGAALAEAEQVGHDEATAEVLRALARAEDAAGHGHAAAAHRLRADLLSPV